VSDREVAVQAAQAVGDLVDELEPEVERPPSAADADSDSAGDEAAGPTSDVVGRPSATPAEEQFDPLAAPPTTSVPSSSSSSASGSGGQSAASKEFGGP
jgi:hypothetical protein